MDYYFESKISNKTKFGPRLFVVQRVMWAWLHVTRYALFGVMERPYLRLLRLFG
jgi:hypothetical protein